MSGLGLFVNLGFVTFCFSNNSFEIYFPGVSVSDGPLGLGYSVSSSATSALDGHFPELANGSRSVRWALFSCGRCYESCGPQLCSLQ